MEEADSSSERYPPFVEGTSVQSEEDIGSARSLASSHNGLENGHKEEEDDDELVTKEESEEDEEVIFLQVATPFQKDEVVVEVVQKIEEDVEGVEPVHGTPLALVDGAFNNDGALHNVERETIEEAQEQDDRTKGKEKEKEKEEGDGDGDNKNVEEEGEKEEGDEEAENGRTHSMRIRSWAPSARNVNSFFEEAKVSDIEREIQEEEHRLREERKSLQHEKYLNMLRQQRELLQHQREQREISRRSLNVPDVAEVDKVLSGVGGVVVREQPAGGGAEEGRGRPASTTALLGVPASGGIDLKRRSAGPVPASAPLGGEELKRYSQEMSTTFQRVSVEGLVSYEAMELLYSRLKGTTVPFVEIWKKADVDGDNKLNLQEFQAAYQMFRPDSQRKSQGQESQNEFTELFKKLSVANDGEHLGFVTLAQMDILCQRAGLPGSAFKRLWDFVDQDKDLLISESEFTTAMKLIRAYRTKQLRLSQQQQLGLPLSASAGNGPLSPRSAAVSAPPKLQQQTPVTDKRESEEKGEPEVVDEEQLVPSSRRIPLIKPLPIDFLDKDDGSLAYASQEGDLETVSRLTIGMKNKELNALHAQTTSCTFTALFLACAQNKPKVVEHLLRQKNIDVNTPSVIQVASTASPLYVACQRGFTDVIACLLSYKNIQLNDGWVAKGKGDCVTPLYVACQNGLTDVVLLLLRHPKINVNKGRTDNGASPLHIAIQQRNKEIIAALLQHKKINVNLKIKDSGFTSLYMAVYNGDHYTASLLIEHTKKVESEDCTGGLTSVHNACFRGDSEMLSLLIYAKVELNSRLEVNGATPLFVAAALGHKQCVDMLLKQPKVDPNIPDKNGTTPLIIACERSHQKVAAMLIGRKGINLNAQRKRDGMTALIAAVHHSLTKTTQMLVAQKALNPNLQHKEYDTALHRACALSNAELVSVLLTHPKIKKDQLGDTSKKAPLHIAVGGSRTEIARLLLEKGAKIDAKTMRTKSTSLFQAAQVENNQEMVGVLLAHGASPKVKGKKDSKTLSVIMASHEDNLPLLLNSLPEKQAVELARKRGTTAPQSNLVNIT